MRSGLLCLTALVLACSAAAQEPAFPSRDVDIHILVFASGRVSVLEEYVLTRPPDRLHLELRRDRCTQIGPISATLGDAAVSLQASERGPWTMLRGSGEPSKSSGSETLRVRYDVELGAAEATLPLVLPSTRLERIEGTRGANVRLTVAFHEDLGGGGVSFPRLDRTGHPLTWHGQFLAVPSLVRLRLPWNDAARCDVAASGPTGGLEWRFWLFTGIMVVWVPLYLWLFGRRKSEG